jgi:hypothetical protein
VLSPCGDLEMSPKNIVNQAFEKNINIIGITDHNATRHCRLISEIAKERDIFVLCGAEVTTKEEVHCLCFMPDFEKLEVFQDYLEYHLPDIKNDVNMFGYQVQVDLDEQIVYEEEKLLISALDQSIGQIEEKVHQLGGIFIPAHINRTAFGLISQLGFVPDDLNYDALEISKHISLPKFLLQNPYLKSKTFIQSSDAHFIENLGEACIMFSLENLSFDEINMALHGAKGRKVNIAK